MKSNRDNKDLLVITIVKAQHLVPTSKNTSCNAFCDLKNSVNSQTFHTSTKKGTLNPTWEESFQLFFDTTKQEKLAYHKIFLKIKDYRFGKLKHKELASAVIPLDPNHFDGSQHEKWYDLQNEDGKNVGSIYLRFRFTAGNPSNPLSRLDAYEIQDLIGEGGFGKVMKAVKKQTGEVFAMKVIEKKNVQGFALESLKREVNILQKLTHPGIVNLHEYIDTPDILYLVMEFVKGGELFDVLADRLFFTEKEAAAIIKEILEAIHYAHKHGVAHRDLKPENVLITSHGNLKIADWGLSKDVTGGLTKLATSVGTPEYVAPEVLTSDVYGLECDLWSIGVLTYILLVGYPPFRGKPIKVIFEKIVSCDYSFNGLEWNSKSAESKDFISKLLLLDPYSRSTAEQCLSHPWINKWNNSENGEQSAPLNLKLLRETSDEYKINSQNFEISLSPQEEQELKELEESFKRKFEDE